MTPTATRSLGASVLFVCLTASEVAAQPATCDERNLLEHRSPARAVATTGFHYLTDARVASDGAPWDSPFAAYFDGERSYVLYDLGASTRITAFFVQADNNDTYQIAVSNDGESWTHAWTVPAVAREGLRGRATAEVDISGRYLRIGSPSGDHAYAIGEVQAFCRRPEAWPPDLPIDLERETRLSLAKIALGFLAVGLFSFPWRRLAGRWERIAYVSLLGASAFTWINFGSFHGERAVHLWDSMHYYLGSKYFDENRYHLLYSCVALAEADDGREADVLARQYRDLGTNRLGDGAAALAHERECRESFSDLRWKAFRQDVRLFRGLMGASWFEESLTDHGYNGTPLWSRIGASLTNAGWESHIPPPELVNSPRNTAGRSGVERAAITVRFTEDRERLSSTLTGLAWIDALLYGGTFALIGWAFGLRTAALAAVFWAVGHPWAYYWTGGGFARAPWLFAATTSVCLLAKGRPSGAGVFLAWSALLRVFPALLFAGVALKLTARVRDPARFLFSFVIALALLVPVSGIDAYPDFVENSIRHQATPLTNHMGLPVLAAWHPDDVARVSQLDDGEDAFARWKELRRRRLAGRRWVYAVLVLALLGMFIPAARALDSARACALGGVLIFALFELTSYYYIFLILLAPLAGKRTRRAVALVALAIATQIASVRVEWFDELHTLDSLLVLVTLVYFLVDVILTERRDVILTEGRTRASVHPS